MPQTDYTQPVLRYHAIPERHDKLRLGNATKRWLSADAATVTADTVAATTATLTNPTVSGTLAVTGTATLTGPVTGIRHFGLIDASATFAVTAAMSGRTFLCTAAAGTQVFTLPAAATAGLIYTFVCGAGAAGGEIRVGVFAGDNIIGKTHGANDATGLVSTATTGLLLNTAGSNVVGDFVTLVSDGVTTWYMAAVAGVWSVT